MEDGARARAGLPQVERDPEFGSRGQIVEASTAPAPDAEEIMHQRASVGNLMADMSAISSKAIENLRGVGGADVATGMRERANEPLKAFLRAQEVKQQAAARPSSAAKPAKSTDPNSPESKRAQMLVKASLGDVYADDEIAQMTEADAEYALKYGSLRGQREVSREGQTGTNERARLAREQSGQRWAEEKGLRWAEMDLDERALAERIAAREQAATAKATARVEDQSKEYGNKYAESGLPEFKDQYAKAQSIFGKYPDSLPGVGFASGRMPRRFTSSDAKLLRTVAGQMLLSYKKSVTGLGSSAKEDEAIREATGLVQTGDDESLKLGVSILKDVMDAKEAALKAGYKPEAVRTVEGRLSPGGARTEPVQQSQAAPRPSRTPAPKPAKPAAADDKVRIILNGKPSRVPRANLEKLKALAAEKKWTLEIPNG